MVHRLFLTKELCIPEIGASSRVEIAAVRKVMDEQVADGRRDLDVANATSAENREAIEQYQAVESSA